MPMKWIEPEVFLTHKGIRVYHVYKDDIAELGSLFFHYGTSINVSLFDKNGDNGRFDVRNLPNPKNLSKRNLACQKKIIKNAIDKGILENWDN